MIIYGIKYQKQHKEQITKPELISYFFSLRKNKRFKFLQKVPLDIAKSISAICIKNIKYCKENPYSLIKKTNDNFKFELNEKLIKCIGVKISENGNIDIPGLGIIVEKNKKIIKNHNIHSVNILKTKNKLFVEIKYAETVKPSLLSKKMLSKNCLVSRFVAVLFITIMTFTLSTFSYGVTVVNGNDTQQKLNIDNKNKKNNEKNLVVINISKNIPRFMVKDGSSFKIAKKSSYTNNETVSGDGLANIDSEETINENKTPISKTTSQQNSQETNPPTQPVNQNNINDNKVEVTNGVKMALPTSIPRTFKCFAYYTVLSSNNKVQKIAYTDELGFRKVDNYYTVALGTYYSSTLGDLFHITTEGGEYDVIVTDIKSDAHTDSLHMYSVGSQCMCEFYVDGKTLVNSVRISGSCEAARKEFSGAITSITYMGNYFEK